MRTKKTTNRNFFVGSLLSFDTLIRRPPSIVYVDLLIRSTVRLGCNKVDKASTRRLEILILLNSKNDQVLKRLFCRPTNYIILSQRNRFCQNLNLPRHQLTVEKELFELLPYIDYTTLRTPLILRQYQLSRHFLPPCFEGNFTSLHLD